MTDYVPPSVWTWDKASGGKFANINRPIAGSTHDKDLPVGKHPFQLYSLATPNGVKVTVMLEELLEAGHSGAEYDAWLIRINEGDQFGSGFVAVNPNSKIPALMDRSGTVPFGCLNRALFCCIWRKSLEHLSRRTQQNVRSACLGSSGKWVAHRIWAVALAISTPMRLAKWSTRSTALPWKSNANWTF
jgi:GSH-dependent disulfide-bond oxidoreductase